jgi:hypothetical protein
MSSWPALLAFFPGLFAGSMLFGIFTHWVTLLLGGWRRNPIAAPLPLTGRVWARIFTVIHPLPWLVLGGIPFGIYKLLTNPPTPGWRWFFGGMIAAVVGLLLMAVVAHRRYSLKQSVKGSRERAEQPAQHGS